MHKIIKGQKLYRSETRRGYTETIREDIVASAGRKWFALEGDTDNRYQVDSLRSEYGCIQLCLTRQELLDAAEHRRLWLSIPRAIECNEWGLDTLRQIAKILNIQ